MKFVCKHCGSKYTIADDRVRKKVLKIRCKKCNNIIEVRDPEQGRQDASQNKPETTAPSALENKFAASFRQEKSAEKKGTPGLYAAVKHSAAVLAQDESDRVHWFVAIEKSPVGPVSARKIHAHRQADRVDDESLVWKEGMVDWTPLRDCKEIVGLLAHIDIETATATKETEKERGPKLGLFEEEKSAPAESPLKGRSVGVIADRLDAPEKEDEAQVPSAPPPGSQTFGNDDDMLMDLDIEGGVGALHTLSPPRAMDQRQNRITFLAAVGFLIVALFTLGVAIAVALVSEDQQEEPETAVQIVEKVVEKVVFRDRPNDDRPSARGAENPQQKESKPASSRRIAKAGKRKPKQKGQETDAKTRELMERLGISAPSGNAPVGSRKKQGQEKASGSGSGQLTSNQLKSVVNRNKRSLKSCYERALKTGEAPDDSDVRVDFKVKVGSSGMVKNVALAGQGARIRSLNSCLTRSVKKWVFPSSSGTSDVEFPFVFTPR